MQVVAQQQVEQCLLPVLIVPQHSCPVQGQQMAAATRTVDIEATNDAAKWPTPDAACADFP